MAKKQKGKARATNARARATKAQKAARKPKDQILPSMEDMAIPEIETLGHRYAEQRDARMEMLKDELGTKELLMGVMKKHGKDLYKRGDLEVRLVQSEETVKVKIKSGRDMALEAE